MPGTPSSVAASSSNSSTASPEMLTMTGTCQRAQIGAFSETSLRSPMFWSPIAFSIPAGVSAILGVGVAGARPDRDALRADRAHPLDVDELLVLGAVAEGAGGHQHRVPQLQPVLVARRQVDAEIRPAARPSSQPLSSPPRQALRPRRRGRPGRPACSRGGSSRRTRGRHPSHSPCAAPSPVGPVATDRAGHAERGRRFPPGSPASRSARSRRRRRPSPEARHQLCHEALMAERSVDRGGD